MMRRAIFALVLGLCMVSAQGAILAQTDPQTPDPRTDRGALINRVVEAHAALAGYFTYVEDMTLDKEQTVKIALQNSAQTNTQTYGMQRHLAVQRTDEGRDLEGWIYTTFTDPTLTARGAPVTVGVRAQIRSVGGEVYLRMNYEPANAGLPRLPVGWSQQEQTDPGVEPAYANLRLNELLDPVHLLSDADLLNAAVTYARQLTIVPPGRARYEVIELFIMAEDLARVLAEEMEIGIDRDMGAAMSGKLTPQSAITIRVTYDASGTPRSFETSIVLYATGIDASVVDPAQFPRGVTLDLLIRTTRTAQYSQINAPLPAVEVPRLGW